MLTDRFGPFLAAKWLVVACGILSFSPSPGEAQTPPQLGYAISGSGPSELFGAAISCVRHFSSLSGADALAASAPFFGVGGRTQVFDGPTGQSVLASFNSPNQFVRTGDALADIGSTGLSPSGLGELLVGNPSSIPASAASTYLVLAGPDGATQFSNFNPAGNSSQLGQSVAGLYDDTNANGHNDFLYGAPDNGTAGVVYLEDIASSSFIRSFPGSSLNPGEGFGSAITSIADLDGDGIRDVLIAAPLSGPAQGRVAAHSSATSSQLFEITGLNPLDTFGQSLADVGDVDGDSKPDFLVGAPSQDASGPGFVRLYATSGVSTPSLLCTLSGSTNGDLFGSSVAYLGDVDGDGVAEFGVGAPSTSGGVGSVFIYSYNQSLRNCVLKFTLVGSSTTDFFGEKLAGSSALGGCDLNGDGAPDFIVGAPASSNGQGKVSVYFGALPPTPTPTPTPSQTSPSRAQLNFKIFSNGSLDGIVRLDTVPTTACELAIYGRTSWSDRTHLGSIMTLHEIKALTTKNSRFQARGLRRALCAPNGAPFSLHLIARVKCGNRKAFYSSVLARQTSCGLSPALTMRQWEAQLESKLN